MYRLSHLFHVSRAGALSELKGISHQKSIMSLWVTSL
jgi:hypothetical protein